MMSIGGVAEYTIWKSVNLLVLSNIDEHYFITVDNELEHDPITDVDRDR